MGGLWSKFEAIRTESRPRCSAQVEVIREALNPHPAGQKTLNAPKKAELTGVQHKYAETVLFFAAAAQTCHAYCTYCFRWAQFIGDADLRFAQKDADSLFDYLEEHEEVLCRRPGAFLRSYAVDATRLHLTMTWVVSFSILSAFRARSRLRGDRGPNGLRIEKQTSHDLA